MPPKSERLLLYHYISSIVCRLCINNKAIFVIAHNPIMVYTIRAKTVLSMKIKVTKLKSKIPIKAQLMPPIIVIAKITF